MTSPATTQSSTGSTKHPAPTVTAAAATKVKQLIEALGETDLCLRALVEPGGCKGLQYGFAFDKRSEIQPTDYTFNTQGITLVVDQEAFDVLKEAIIDYKIDISGEQFFIDNPNAASHCGCGKSFCEKKDSAQE